MGLTATPFASHATVPAPAAPAGRGVAPFPPGAPYVPGTPNASGAPAIGAVWPSRLTAPWPLPDVGLAAAGQPARLFTEGAVAVVRGVTAADVAAGLRYLAARIEQGSEAVVRVESGFACEAERVAPVFAADAGRR